MSSPAVLQNSSFSTPFTAANLPSVQAQVVAALAQGRSVRTAVEQAKTHFAQSLADELRDLSAAALETLRSILTGPIRRPPSGSKPLLPSSKGRISPTPAGSSPDASKRRASGGHPTTASCCTSPNAANLPPPRATRHARAAPVSSTSAVAARARRPLCVSNGAVGIGCGRHGLLEHGLSSFLIRFERDVRA